MNSPKQDRASDYYKDLILAVISTSALLITISLTLVTLTSSTNILGISLKSRSAIGVSSFFFLVSIVASTFSYQRMVGVLHAGKDFYENRIFRALLSIGVLAYVAGALVMFLSIYTLAFGGAG